MKRRRSRGYLKRCVHTKASTVNSNLLQVAKKLVRGDFKTGRVKDPSAPIGSKHEKVVRTFVKDFMDKAVKKKNDRDKGKAARAGGSAMEDTTVTKNETDSLDTPRGVDEMLSDTERSKSHDVSPDESYLKRKREGDDHAGSPKRGRTETAPTPPPPPPPPPADEMPGLDSTTLTPQDEESSSLLSIGGMDVNTVVTNGKPRFPLDDIVQLATPPTNGSSEHSEYAEGRNSDKRSLAFQSGS